MFDALQTCWRRWGSLIRHPANVGWRLGTRYGFRSFMCARRIFCPDGDWMLYTSGERTFVTVNGPEYLGASFAAKPLAPDDRGGPV
jgi:hypothetical protein